MPINCFFFLFPWCRHPFFKEIDWDLLYQKKIPAPFKPKIKDNKDTSCFDEEFLSQPISDSVGEHGNVLSKSVQKEFEGFTYTGPTKLKEADKVLWEGGPNKYLALIFPKSTIFAEILR